jgi:hypothetical protein
MDREFEDRLLAKLFGIPKCCVDYYCKNRATIRSAHAITGGIRLCPVCAKKPESEYIKNINKERICPRPFPDMPSESDLDMVLSDGRFTSQEREWLESNTNRFVETYNPNDPVSILRTYTHDLEKLTSSYKGKTQSDPDISNVHLSSYKMKVLDLETKTIETIFIQLRSRIQTQQKNSLI